MNIEVLKKAIEKYGVSNQMDMVVEECAELIQAVNKLKRISSHENKFFCSQPNKESSNKYCKSYFDLCSEVADVKIMIAQLEIILNKEAIDLSVERKLERLEKRI